MTTTSSPPMSATSSSMTETSSPPMTAKSSPPISPYIHLVLFPLALIDLLAGVILFIYVHAFQLSLYLVYIGLFIWCHATGNYHKLENSGEIPSVRIKQTMKKVRNVEVEEVGRFKVELVVDDNDNESGYFTDVDVDVDVDFTDVDVEE
eukprot:GFUD01019411.1.p1 GENE.GFUD01019411.1~~GFUD01019411.1.p1  ORF type:complete len:149 (-),score=28.36 GFUD01019411.1:40-486(-)